MSERVREQQLLCTKLQGVCSAAGDLVLHSNPFKCDGVLTFDIVSTRTPTANAVVTIEFERGPMIYGLRSFKMATGNWWYKTRGPVYVPTDWAVKVTFSAAGNKQICEACLYGHVQYNE